MESTAVYNTKNKVRPIHQETQKRTETDLVHAAKAGEAAAFTLLYERYATQLYRATQRITRNREDAEDAVQDALLSALRHVGDFDGRSSFSTWLTRIAMNSALMILRKRRNWIGIASDAEDDFESDGPAHQVADRGPSPESHFARTEEDGILHRAVQKLRPRLRQIIQIQHLQDRSIRETAKVVGITVAATKARLFHAKAALRRSPALKLMRQSRLYDRARALTAA